VTGPTTTGSVLQLEEGERSRSQYAVAVGPPPVSGETTGTVILGQEVITPVSAAAVTLTGEIISCWRF
jgi:hypothetical protein